MLSRLSAMSQRRPVTVIVVSVLASLVLAVLAGQAEREDEVEVDSERSVALDVSAERFSDPTSVVQVLIRGDDEVRSVDGLRTVRAIEDAVHDSDLADTLAQEQGPPSIVSYLAGVELQLEAGGESIEELTDEDVQRLATDPGDTLPDDAASMVDGLLADTDPATSGMVLVFQDTTDLDDEQAHAQQARLAEVIDAVEVPAGITVDAFAFELLMGGDDDVGAEVAQLFGTALAAVLLVLGLVYWPGSRGRRPTRLRRTAADLLLTLAVIVMAVVWMQGLGVLLGPDYLGVLGYFSPSSQIVPVLIVSLGVDFSVHLFARYRDERDDGRASRHAAGRAATTVGVALALGTAATATGLLTNLTSPLDFLGMLGVLAAIGIVAAFVLTLTWLSAVRLLLDERGDRRASGHDTSDPQQGADAEDSPQPGGAIEAHAPTRPTGVVARAAWLAERAPIATLSVALLVALVGAAGTTQLESRFSVTDFVPRDEPMLETFETITEEFDGGFEGEVEILLSGNLLAPTAHNQLVDVDATLRDLDLPGATTDDVTSPVSLLRDAHGDDQLSDRLSSLGVEADGTVADDVDLEAAYALMLEHLGAAESIVDLDADVPVARIVLDTPVPPGSEDTILTTLDTSVTPLADHDVTAIPTSQELVEHELTEQIADSQLLSLLIALTASTLLLAGYFRVTRREGMLGVVTVLPVGLVITLTLAAMAMTGIPLNPVTATLAALSIGIAVPFMVHITNRYLEERARPGMAVGPIRRTLAATGTALATSAVTSAVGFGVLATSSMLPFQQLGQVTLFAIATSFVAATVVLPSLLALWERRRTGPTIRTATGARHPTGSTPPGRVSERVSDHA